VPPEIRLANGSDADAIRALRRLAFNLPASGGDPNEWRTCWVAVLDGRVVASAEASVAGQFFGGCSVPTAMITGVAVSPEARRRGVGSALLEGIHAELSDQQIGLATLYPSAMGPYRAAGYAVAGDRIRFRLPLTQLPRRPPSCQLHRIDGPDADVRSLYRAFASGGNGLMDRSAAMWAEIATAADAEVQWWVATRSGSVRGYTAFALETTTGPMPSPWSTTDSHYNYDIVCRDLVCADDDAAASLLDFFAGFTPMGRSLRWTAPMQDRVVRLLGDEQPTVEVAHRWMSRLLDVPAAMSARGWNPAAECEVRLAIVHGDSSDAVLELQVQSGQASAAWVSERPDATLGLGTLSAVFTGWLCPRQAVGAGLIRGADDRVAAELAAAVAGPPPWSMDVF
jgi:predicted acetyltransferase